MNINSLSNSGDHTYTNGVTTFNTGGSHEQNPHGGIQQGVAPDGQPNLVEEGEVKYKDYIFSNRLYATEKELRVFNLPKKYKDHTFADIAERIADSHSERPSDPITLRTLDAELNRLKNAQNMNKKNKK